jgi:hypothetical protein
MRIVSMSSDTHRWVWGTPAFESLKSLNKHSSWMAGQYGLSKLMVSQLDDSTADKIYKFCD